MSLIHDRDASRFRLPLEGGDEAYIEYSPLGSTTLDLLHTIVPPEAQGEGVGTRLVEEVLGYAREHNLRIVPSCRFVAAYLEEHPEQADLVA
jgi:predicted GNAT family acetyltransferase